MNHFDKAISLFKNQTELARALGVNPMLISHWKKRGVPSKHCVSIERLTGGVVKAANLRPDIFGDLD